MIYAYQLSNLLSQWEGRLSEMQDTNYCFAIRECARDLRSLIDKAYEEEAQRELELYNSIPDEEAQEWLLNQEADNYLSSMS